MDAVGEVYAEEPENCNVCCDASELTTTSEEKAVAVELSETLIAKFEFPLIGTYLLESAKLEISDFNEFNSLATLANAEISVCLVVLSSSSIFFLGTVSASTKLSTI